MILRVSNEICFRENSDFLTMEKALVQIIFGCVNFICETDFNKIFLALFGTALKGTHFI